MNKLSLIFGILLITGSFFFIKDDLRNYQIEKNGEIVEMQIIDKPASCLGTKSNYHIKLKYKNKVLIKKVGGSFCEEHSIGDLVEMKYIEDSERVLFPKESTIIEIISGSLLGILGLVIIYFGQRNKGNVG